MRDSLLSCQAPVTTITRPVMVQITRVSINGSIIATRPSRTGSLVRAAACAMGEDPSPASLENRPRATPQRMASPTAAPPTAQGLRAWLKIRAKAAGMSPR